MDDDPDLPPILPPAQHSRYVGASANWRAPELPGLDAPAPAGAAPVKVDKRTLARYVKIRKTFDRPKAVEQFRPYAEIAEEAREGMLQEMAAQGPVDVRVSFVIDAAARQDMYKREALAAHSVLRLNHDLPSSVAGAWAEDQILERSQKLTRAALGVWPRPSIE